MLAADNPHTDCESMHSKRISSCFQEDNELQTSAGNPWSRRGGAICSILSLLLLGAALVAYGSGALMIGHNPLQEGQQEQWRRVARIRMYQIRKETMGNTHDGVTHASKQPVEGGVEEGPVEPHSQQLAFKIKDIFEKIISSEELPRKPGSLGSLTDHLKNTVQSAQPHLDDMQSLQQVTAASLKAERPHLRYRL